MNVDRLQMFRPERGTPLNLDIISTRLRKMFIYFLFPRQVKMIQNWCKTANTTKNHKERFIGFLRDFHWTPASNRNRQTPYPVAHVKNVFSDHEFDILHWFGFRNLFGISICKVEQLIFAESRCIPSENINKMLLYWDIFCERFEKGCCESTRFCHLELINSTRIAESREALPVNTISLVHSSLMCIPININWMISSPVFTVA